MISLNPRYLPRYAAIARLLIKYGCSDLVRKTDLQSALQDEAELTEQQCADPEHLAEDLERLGPTFVKLGQVLSTRSDLLPPVYLHALTRLQDDVEPVPFADIERTISEDLGVRLSRGFSEFEEKPLASASIAQVHKARLRDGRQVAVKVQRPGIRQRIADDLDAMIELAEALDSNTDFGRRYRFTSIVESLREVMVNELDFRQESVNSRMLRENLQHFEQFIVPEVIESYSSGRVLTMEYISGAKITDVSPAVLIELDRRGLADNLFRIYLHQVLIDGLFHADPHPGNILLTHDKRLALMDFGMVVRVPPEMRQKLVKLLMTIGEGQGEETAEVAMAIGTAYDESFSADKFRHEIARLVAAHQNLPLEELHAGSIVMAIQAAAGEAGLRLPNEVTMLGKTLLNLDKVVDRLDPRFNPNEALHRHATEIFQEHATRRLSLGRLYHSLMETGEFIERLPERLNKIAQLVANNELRVHVDAIDERRLISGLQKIANRITVGLILAAMIVAAALMMQLETEAKIFGYPAIAMVFLIMATTMGLILIWNAVFHDERQRPRNMVK